MSCLFANTYRTGPAENKISKYDTSISRTLFSYSWGKGKIGFIPPPTPKGPRQGTCCFIFLKRVQCFVFIFLFEIKWKMETKLLFFISYTTCTLFIAGCCSALAIRQGTPEADVDCTAMYEDRWTVHLTRQLALLVSAVMRGTNFALEVDVPNRADTLGHAVQNVDGIQTL